MTDNAFHARDVKEMKKYRRGDSTVKESHNWLNNLQKDCQWELELRLWLNSAR